MTMKKKVNIQSNYPLYVFTPPLTGVINGAELTYPEIYNCLGQGAIINEVLPDGSELRLNYQNYNKVNVSEPKKEIITNESIEDKNPVDNSEDKDPVDLEPEDKDPADPEPVKVEESKDKKVKEPEQRSKNKGNKKSN